MATAEELLAEGVEPNEVSDHPKFLVIDNDLRTINIPVESKVLGVESDENVNRLYFTMPKTYDGTDLSKFAIYINYMNANSEDDIYVVTDAEVSGDEITFSWLVGRNATRYKGEVNFIVCLKRSENGEVVQEFNTTVHTLTVLEGLEVEVTEGEEMQVRDVLAQLLSLVDAQKDTAIAAVKAEGAVQVNTVNKIGATQITAIEQKGSATLATIPADYTTTYNRAINSAVAIPDESALAASHELHAQRDYPLNVVVHGYTYQEGEGDPSPENVRPIHGMDAAQVRAGGINLWEFGDLTVTQGKTLAFKEPLKPGRYVISGVTTSTDTDNYENTVTISGNNIIFHRNTRRAYAFTLNKEATSLSLYSARSNDKAEGDVSTWTDMMIEYGTEASKFEPYNPYANVITPPLLPDNSPLMEGDTVENWVLSGCDKCVTFDGSEDEDWEEQVGALTVLNSPIGKSGIVNGSAYSNYLVPYPRTEGVSWQLQPLNSVYGNKYGIGVKIDGVTNTGDTKDEKIANLRAYLAANPLTVYYRSTDYTPEKDLRVTKVTRKWMTKTLNGSEVWTPYTGLSGCYFTDLSTNIVAGSTITESYVYGGGTPKVDVGKMFVQGGYRLVFSTSYADVSDWKEQLAAVNMIVTAQLATPEIYMTDPLPLLPPAALESDTVTVTGSGETEVEYAHDTKHFIIDFVTKALASQS